MHNKLAILIDYLTELGLEADPDKVNTIPQFPRPDNRRQLQRFLCMVKYLRQFCPDLAAAAALLSELQASIKQWKCTDLHSHPLQECKDFIMSNEVLKRMHAHPDQRIYLICDASDAGLSG